VYTGGPVGQGILPRQPAVFAAQPSFLNQSVVGQQQGVNIVRPMGAANMQPLYRTMEPLAHQQPPNQASFLVPNASAVQPSPHQPVFVQRLSSPASDRPLFDGNVVHRPVSLQSSLPGYVDFGGGEGNNVRFKADFCSDPEIVGQPIETVIHNRKGPARPGDSRAAVAFGHIRAARPFFGAK